MRQRTGLTMLLLGAVMLAACGGGASSAAKATDSGGTASSAQNVTLRSTDQMRFEPASLAVRANTPVSLTLDNSGAALVHDVTIDDVGGQRVHIVAQPHSRSTGQFTLPAGTYQFYCAQPGHKEAGMVGTLTVS
jgi:uncharacterized cupredoxin-like copper-binding protein